MKKAKILFLLVCSLLINAIPVYATQPITNHTLELKDSFYVTVPINEASRILNFLSEEEPEDKTIPVEDEFERNYYTIVDGSSVATLPKELQNWVYQMCEEYGISGYERMIIAKLYAESSFNPNLIHTNKNGTKDYGLAQINSCNHKRLSNVLGITDYLDPYQSIRAGVYMIAECLSANGYNEAMALAAYNTGKNGISTTPYTRRVLSLKEAACIQEF